MLTRLAEDHGYVLADMAVHQTREYFLERDGYIADNGSVGPTLTEAYWKCGNSEMFLDLVENLTGKPLTGDAWVSDLKETTEDVLKSEKAKYDAKLAECAAEADSSSIDLDMRIRLVDGDEVLADTATDGSFEKSCEKFKSYVQERFGK